MRSGCHNWLAGGGDLNRIHSLDEAYRETTGNVLTLPDLGEPHEPTGDIIIDM